MSNKRMFNKIFLFLFLIIKQFILIQTSSICPYSLSNKKPTDLSQITETKSYYVFADPCHYVYSYINNQIGMYSNDIIYPQIDIPKNCLSNYESLANGGTLFIGKAFLIKDSRINPSNKLIDIIGFEIYYINNGELNALTPTCAINDILTYYLPIITKDNALKNKYQSVMRQNHDSDEISNYDIFNQEADIYNDICTTITFNENIDDEDSFENFDMTLKNRRNYYFPENIELCPLGFNFDGIDRDTFSAKCKISLDSFYNNPINNNGDTHTFNKLNADSDFKSGKKDINGCFFMY